MDKKVEDEMTTEVAEGLIRGTGKIFHNPILLKPWKCGKKGRRARWRHRQ